MKKRIISLLLCMALLIGVMPMGLFTFTVSAAEETYLEYLVTTFDELKAALAQSSPDQTKRITIDRTIRFELDLDNTELLGDEYNRFAFDVVDKNIISFTNGACLDITTKPRVDYIYDTLVGGYYYIPGYRIFNFRGAASLVISQQGTDTAMEVDAHSNCTLFGGTGPGNLTICGGSYYFNVHNTVYESQSSQALPTDNRNGISYFANRSCTVISANLYYYATPSEKDGYSGNYCFGDSVSLFDSNIEMYASPKPISYHPYHDSSVFGFPPKKVVESKITTKGAATLNVDYSRIAAANSIYQNGRIVNESSYQSDFVGTTNFKFKAADSAITTRLVYRDGEQPIHTYIEYKPGYTGYAGIFYIGDNIISDVLPDEIDGINMPYTYEEYCFWPIYKIVDGEYVPVSFKPEVELVNGYYCTKNGEPLNTDRLNNAIEGGMQTREKYVISGAFAIGLFKGNHTTTIIRKVESDFTILVGISIETPIEVPKENWNYISSGYQFPYYYPLTYDYDHAKCIITLQKQEIKNGLEVWRDMEKGDIVTPGLYRNKIAVIPVSYYDYHLSVRLQFDETHYHWLEKDSVIDYPNIYAGTGYNDYEDKAVIYYSPDYAYIRIYPNQIRSAALDGTVDYGDKLSEVFSVSADGSKIYSEKYKEGSWGFELVDAIPGFAEVTATLWYHNGEIVSSDEIAESGKYSALIKVEADECHQFIANPTAIIFGQTVTAQSVSEDGRFAFFQSPTVTLTCAHAGDMSAISSDDKNHWHVCSVCGMTYGKEEHTFDEGVISGGKTTYTCTECSFKKTVSNGKEELDWLLINTKPLTVGSKLPEITAGNYNDEKVTLIGYAWSAGTNYATAVPVYNDAVVEAGKNYYLDIDFMTKSGYYVSDETTVRLNGVTASEKTVSSGGSMINAIISQIPVYAAEATVVVPELTVGKTMEKVLDEIGESVISQNFYGVEVEITENGVKNTYYKNIYTSGWKAYSDSVPYNTFKNRTVLPGSTYSFKLHLQMVGMGYFVTEDNITIKNKSLADSVAVATTSTEVSAIVIYTTEGDNKTITNAVLSVELPVTGNTPATTADAGDGNFTVKKIEWNGSPVKFAANTAYTVTLTLQPKSGFAFDPNAGAFVNGNLAGTSKNGDNLIVTYTFPKTYKVGQTVAFENETVSVAYGGTVTQTATAETAVTYSVVSGGDVASVDPSTGKVTTLKSGKAVIKATAEASDSYYSGEATYTLTVTKLDGPSAPSCTFSLDGTYAGRLIGSTSDMEYSLNGGLLWNSCIANIALDTEDIFESFDIQIRYKATDTVNAGDIQTIDITKADAPTGLVSTDCTTEANNDGTITGVTTAMEYQKSGASGWTGIGSTTVTGLTNGTYYVRYKATGTTLASDVYTVTVNAYTENTTVSGSVTSFGSASDKITISLYETGQSTPAYTTQVTGNSTNYSISGVAAGTYTMTVSKANHITREYTVTVGSENVTQDVKIYLFGDANGDGSVDSKDLSLLRKYMAAYDYTTGTSTVAVQPGADANGDGTIDSKDLSLLRKYMASYDYTTGTSTVVLGPSK